MARTNPSKQHQNHTNSLGCIRCKMDQRNNPCTPEIPILMLSTYSQTHVRKIPQQTQDFTLLIATQKFLFYNLTAEAVWWEMWKWVSIDVLLKMIHCPSALSCNAACIGISGVSRWQVKRGVLLSGVPSFPGCRKLLLSVKLCPKSATYRVCDGRL